MHDSDRFQENDDGRSANRGRPEKRRNHFREKMAQGWPSPRTYKLIEIIKSFMSRHICKMIVFSEYLCVLDVAHAALAAQGYKVVRYDGWLNQSDREAATSLFEVEGNGCDFLLMTNRSGGLGLNLPIAKEIIHLTPCWNPALTAQCTGRAVRPGQEDIVKVWHSVAEESLETYVRALARQKNGKLLVSWIPRSGRTGTSRKRRRGTRKVLERW